MKEIIEEYGGIVVLAIIGSLVIGGFLRGLKYMSDSGIL